MPNHVLMNHYQPGDGIVAHKDGPNYEPVVATLSLGAGIVFHFLRYDSPAISLVLPPRSLLIFEEGAYQTYQHNICSQNHDKLQEDVIANWDSRHRAAWLADGWLGKQLQHEQVNSSILLRRERISLTFRHVKNYTARGSCEEALSVDPQDPDAWFKLGALGGGKFNGHTYTAQDCSNKANAIIFYNFGAAGGGDVRGRMYSATECYEEALSLDPAYVVAWSNLGAVGGGNVDLQKYSGRECYEKALSLNPEFADGWVNLGTTRGGEVDGKIFSEKECYQKALSLNPQDGGTWFNLGTMGGGHVDGQGYSGKNCYDKAVSLDRKYSVHLGGYAILDCLEQIVSDATICTVTLVILLCVGIRASFAKSHVCDDPLIG
eukprot:gnl/MRDRNA2_/MRDRNA2_72762_c0_seq1.p1 gnl/MRDRNA2_/MRDRNA2_72762_c0~~gnl/MRDRNA2_/MRDRNA2_72762_c0_seq1.p1  ORF type:complete len:413 (-),score=67.63 gnl/MRDRNA2_/MRDRNA2_72762_c0_seq1:63-1190(-)